MPACLPTAPPATPSPMTSRATLSPPTDPHSRYQICRKKQPVQSAGNSLVLPAHRAGLFGAYDACLDCARTFAQRALCAAAMRSRAAADSLFLVRLPEPDDLKLIAVALLSSAITFSSCRSLPTARSRSSFNCSRTASRSGMHSPTGEPPAPEDTSLTGI